MRTLEESDAGELKEIVKHLESEESNAVFKPPTKKRFIAEVQRLQGHQQAAASIAKEVAEHLEHLSPRDDQSPGHSPQRRRTRQERRTGGRAAEARGRGRAAVTPRRGKETRVKFEGGSDR